MTTFLWGGNQRIVKYPRMDPTWGSKSRANWFSHRELQWLQETLTLSGGRGGEMDKQLLSLKGKSTAAGNPVSETLSVPWLLPLQHISPLYFFSPFPSHSAGFYYDF